MIKIDLIFQKIANLVYGIIPVDDDRVLIRGRLYPDFYQIGIRRLSCDGLSELLETESLISDKVLFLLQDLQKCDYFKEEVWNHFELFLNRNGELIFNYINIIEEDTFPNLNMKGVSDLSEYEAKAQHIPLKIWQERVKIMKNGPHPELHTVKCKMKINSSIESTILEPNKIIFDKTKGNFINIKDTLQLIIPDDANAAIYEFEVFNNGVSSKLRYIDLHGKKHDIPTNSIINNYKTDDIIEALMPLFKESYEYSLSQGEQWNSAVFTVYNSGQAEMSTI